MKSGQLIDVSVEQLDGILSKSNSAGLTELAIISRRVPVCPDPRDWPDELKGALVYRVNEPISEIGRWLTNLARLTKLVVSGFDVALREVERIAKDSVSLKSLALVACKIGEAEVCAVAENLQHLISLNLTDNKIGEGGARTIAKNLSKLTTLNLELNEIGDAGAQAIAENLQQIVSLNLCFNEIGEVGARSIAKNLQQLTTLNLDVNEIGDAGARAIAENLPQIISLSLSATKIADAGARAIAENLSKLTALNLGYNRIRDAGVRAIAENLQQLTSLFIGENKIGDEGALAISRNVRNLSYLNLRNTGISDSAIIAIAADLPQITSLDVSENRHITNVSPLAVLGSLKRLDLDGTGVSDLSGMKGFVLGGITVLSERPFYRDGINVIDCPLVHPSIDIVNQGSDAVLNYFREIEAQGVDRLYEAKVLILGGGGAGKTSLLRRLYHPDLPLPNEKESTKGIEIHRHVFKTPRCAQFWLNVWDFGGQHIYHATHQFFLTKNSLYILVDDTRKDDKSVNDDGFKYWLEVEEVLSDSSPMLIFQNEKEGRSKTIDEAGIKGRFPNVKDIYRGNLDLPAAADNLRSAIEHHVQQLKHIGEEVPTKWVSIRRAIEQRSTETPYISQNEYFDIYRQHLEFDRNKALHLSRYLHDLGVFLHFQDDSLLRRTVVLQNQWATEAVFTMLDDEAVKQRFGRFTREDCKRLWADSVYADMHPELLAMMVNFELCYPLDDTEQETWLAPELMSPSRPSSLASWKSPSDMVISFRYTFLPKGLVNRLMVRMHRFVKRIDQAWSNGVLFEHEDSQVLVQVVVQPESHAPEIELRARGHQRKALLSVISSALEGLNNRFKGLEGKVQQWIPCRCENCQQDTSPQMFDRAKLIRRQQANQPTVECDKSYERVSVSELLDGLKLDSLPEWATTPELSQAVKTIKIFLASSSELKSDRDDFELYFRARNDRLRKNDICLEFIRWENFLDKMSETRLQDDYNKKVREADIFVSLFWTKAGKFTEEEFDIAFDNFKNTKKPVIYTFFKNESVSIGSLNPADFQSLWEFQKKLKDLGHYHTNYDNIEHLKRQFIDQLEKLIYEGHV